MDYLHFVKTLKIQQKSNTSQFFLAYLLVLLTGVWPCFCFRAVNLTVSLIILRTILMALKIAVSLLRGFL